VIRLPQLWRRVETLEVKASYARFVARRTRDLTVDQAAYVDERSAESADGRIPWSRFEDLVTGLIVASDPEAVEGHGPVTEAWVRDHLGPDARFTIRPILDIEGQAPVDSYESPTDIVRPCIS
jgi:hypothetical protein